MLTENCQHLAFSPVSVHFLTGAIVRFACLSLKKVYTSGMNTEISFTRILGR